MSIIRQMAPLDPEGDWDRRGAQALDPNYHRGGTVGKARSQIRSLSAFKTKSSCNFRIVARKHSDSPFLGKIMLLGLKKE